MKKFTFTTLTEQTWNRNPGDHGIPNYLLYIRDFPSPPTEDEMLRALWLERNQAKLLRLGVAQILLTLIIGSVAAYWFHSTAPALFLVILAVICSMFLARRLIQPVREKRRDLTWEALRETGSTPALLNLITAIDGSVEANPECLVAQRRVDPWQVAEDLWIKMNMAANLYDSGPDQVASSFPAALEAARKEQFAFDSALEEAKALHLTS
ncbi:MAG TPA: hypothetical protein VLA04_03450 [Verrucomicrobiae bacterium]|nr:hypothetical protein [Verrucomicrobiae bacterium]